MTKAALRGVGVLVTRPTAQAQPLVDAIQAAGGLAIRFPVMEIEARAECSILAEVAELPTSDIVIFASPNAVEHGLRYAADALTGAIGPATAAAIRSRGRVVDICPASGFNSESLLNEPLLQCVSDRTVLIIRGSDGRELLAETLIERGAKVDYLSVYERKLPRISPRRLTNTEVAWRNGEIAAITVMSVATLESLIALLPEFCVARLESIQLVTPAARVIKEALARYPQLKTVLAPGPAADDMVQAIIAARQHHSRD